MAGAPLGQLADSHWRKVIRQWHVSLERCFDHGLLEIKARTKLKTASRADNAADLPKVSSTEGG